MILIISFNARAIAHLAKKMDLEIAVVDFWCDQDLFPLTDKVFTVFKPSFKSYAVFPNPRENEEKLVELALEIISKEDIESVLIGSGLDDRPELWEKINTKAPILGNKPSVVKEVRDMMVIHEKLKRANIKFPLTFQLSDISNMKDLTMQIDYPLVIKPIMTLGGMGIYLIQNKSELIEFYNENSDNLDKYYIQEYIRGINISTTMVGDKNNFKLLSINEQLIGLKSSKTNEPFKYCGNIIPFDCSSKIAQKIKDISLKIARMFKLIGVFGIDFVLQNSEPVFMEINPRFPGTIELLEIVSQLNIVKIHLDAIQKIIPQKIEPFQGYAMKQVLFASKSARTPELGHVPHLYDIPFPNILLNPEDPICTIQLFDTSRKNLLQKMDLFINQIYLKMY
ncbi:MAG: ATP-grasp domain-containing protein [Promethearchaeota archaeon]